MTTQCTYNNLILNGFEVLADSINNEFISYVYRHESEPIKRLQMRKFLWMDNSNCEWSTKTQLETNLILALEN